MPQYGVLDANRIAVKVPGAAQEKCGANEFLARQLPEPFEAPVERQRRVQSDKWPEGSKKGNIRQGGRWRCTAVPGPEDACGKNSDFRPSAGSHRFQRRGIPGCVGG